MIVDFPGTVAAAFLCAEEKSLAQKTFITTSMNRISYGETTAMIRKLTSLYQSWGLAPGNRVAFSTKDDIHASILFLSLLCNGLTAVFLDPETKRDRAAHLLDVSKPKAVILDGDLMESWDVSGVETVLCVDTRCRVGGLSKLFGKKRSATDVTTYPLILGNFEAGEPPKETDPESDAFILFTSGTTNAPKGVRISHRALCVHLATLTKVYGYSSETRILDILPLSHVDGIVQGPIIAFFNTAQLFNPFRFTISRIIELLDAVYHYRITHFICVPTMLALILRFASEEKDAFLTEDFQYISSSGAQLEADFWQRFEENFGVMIINLYGLTETVVGGIFAGPDKESHKIGTIGKPVDCEARIIDEKGRDVPKGEAGELLLRGANIMSGYFDDHEATAEAFIDGWFRTGDIACCDEDGIYRIVGRKKSTIICGGVNVQPEEVAEVLHTHPHVTEAVAFGLPDQDWGEKVVAAVAINDEATSQEDLIRFCRHKLEEVKVPDTIDIFDALPRGRSGKVQLGEVKAQFFDGHAASADASNEMEQQIIEIAAASFKVPVESLTINDSAETTTGWDSLSHLEMIVVLEETFSIKFSPVEIMQMDNLATAVKTVRQKA